MHTQLYLLKPCVKTKPYLELKQPFPHSISHAALASGASPGAEANGIGQREAVLEGVATRSSHCHLQVPFALLRVSIPGFSRNQDDAEGS